MKYMAIEQITRLESSFYVVESNARAEAEILTRQYGGEWMVEPVPDSFPVNEERLLRNYKPKEIMAMIKNGRKNLTTARSEWISVKDQLPYIGVQVVLLADRWWNTPDDVPDARVTATGYLSDVGSPEPYWCIFGERSVQLNDFPHWMKIPTPPKVDKKAGSN